MGEAIPAVGWYLIICGNLARKTLRNTVVRRRSKEIADSDRQHQKPRRVGVGWEPQQLSQLHFDIALETSADHLNLGHTCNPYSMRAGGNRLADFAVARR